MWRVCVFGLLVVGHGSENNASEAMPALVYRHFSKCGGTFLRTLVPAVVKGSNNATTRKWVAYASNGKALASEPHHEPWPVTDNAWVVIDRSPWPDHLRIGPSKFVMLGIRNPCEWYQSYYHYLPNQPLHDVGVKRLRDFNKKPSEFKFDAWLRLVTMKPDWGYMSWRLWAAYLARAECYKIRYVEMLRIHEGPCSVEEATYATSRFDPATVADCWVRTASLTDDTASCLAAWSSTHVDWRKFAELTDPRTAPLSMFGGEQKDPRRDHAPCSDEFTDEARDLVRRADPSVFYAFGFASCCEKTTPEPTRPVDVDDDNETDTRNRTILTEQRPPSMPYAATRLPYGVKIRRDGPFLVEPGQPTNRSRII